MDTPVASPFLERLQQAATAALDHLAYAGIERWEVFAKASSTQRTTAGGGERISEVLTQETGVAIRTYRSRRSGFAAASGIGSQAARRAIEAVLSSERPATLDPLPPARLLGLGEVPPPPEKPPRGWAAHTLAELRESVAAAAGARLAVIRTEMQEGRFSWALTTSDGFTATHRDVGCSMFVEVADIDGEGGVWRDWSWVPDPGRLDPRREAGRITDRVLLRARAGPARTGVRDVLLHNEVAAHLLASVAPLFIARPARRDPLPNLVDQQGRLASPALTVIDDRAGAYGPLRGPCDGEGLPARPTTLLEEGVPRHRVATFKDASLCDEPPRGGAIRISYREAPRSGTANLLVDARNGVAPGELLASANRLLYLLRPVGAVEADLEGDRFRIVASGLSLSGGRIETWHPVVELAGRLGELLRRIAAVGTDLRWFQTSGGFVGTPSVLVQRQPVVGGA